MKKSYSFLLAALILGAATARAKYHVEKNIGEGEIGSVSQLAVGAGDALCVLDTSGKVTLFNLEGLVTGTVDTGIENISAMTVDSKGHLHIFSHLTEVKKVKVGARMRTVKIPIGVECSIFDVSGKKLKTMKFDNLKSAKTAQIIGDTLVVADIKQRALILLDMKTGAETGRISKGLRLCCGIFGFCKAPDNTLAVSNLGAFKVQQFDLDGNLIMEFGRRGRGMDDFQGCCNPVNANYLPDGRILTVEKDPTRIKIYDANGKNAQQIEGIEELVKGCSSIPSAVDSKGNIYLGNYKKRHIVKCIP